MTTKLSAAVLGGLLLSAALPAAALAQSQPGDALQAIQAHDAKLDAHDDAVGAGLEALSDLQPIPISECGTTITESGSYRLTQNLDSTGGDCLTVAADFVTLDLGGFTIKGDGGTGIAGSGTAEDPLFGTTVRNGAVTGFEDGIGISGLSIGTVIEDVRAFENTNGGILVRAVSVVRNSSAILNGVGGIGVGNSSTVVGNTVGGGGIGIEAAVGSTISGNTVTGYRDLGIKATCPSTIVGNTIVALTTTPTGADLRVNSDDCTLADNTADQVGQ